MAYPRTPGGLFPLTTAPTGNNAGGLYPTTDRLVAAIRSLAPTAYWRQGDAAGPLLDTAQRTSTTITLATSADADDIVDTVEDHGFVTGDSFTFATLTGGSNVTAGTTYYVIATSLAAKTFKFSATAGGAAVDFGSDITAGTIVRAAPSLWNAAVTGSPTYSVAAASPVTKAITWSGSGQYATTSGSVPNPTTAITAGCFFATTNATAAARRFFSRGATAQYSWGWQLNNDHSAQWGVLQSDASGHCSVNLGSSLNDGLWRLAVGVFNGTRADAWLVNPTGTVTTAGSTSLTGSWYVASTAGVQIAARASLAPFPGSLAHCFVINDRALTLTDVRWLASVAFGG